MKVLVTGGAGFIGSHLVEELLHRNADVYVIDNLSAGLQQHIHPRAHFRQFDLLDDHLESYILKLKPDIVFHLAAHTDVQSSLLHPQLTVRRNVEGTIRLLELSRRSHVKKFVFASTSGVYGHCPNVIYETRNTKPISPYALSKLNAEACVKMYGRLYNLEYTILRYANVYGPRQKPTGEGGAVAQFMARISTKQPLTIYGDGEQTRDFVYVKDVVQANINAVSKGNGKTIHISSARRTSINDLCRYLEQIHGQTIERKYRSKKIGDIEHSCLSNMKARHLLRWKPTYTLRRGLACTYEAEFKNNN